MPRSKIFGADGSRPESKSPPYATVEDIRRVEEQRRYEALPRIPVFRDPDFQGMTAPPQEPDYFRNPQEASRIVRQRVLADNDRNMWRDVLSEVQLAAKGFLGSACGPRDFLRISAACTEAMLRMFARWNRFDDFRGWSVRPLYPYDSPEFQRTRSITLAVFDQEGRSQTLSVLAGLAPTAQPFGAAIDRPWDNTFITTPPLEGAFEYTQEWLAQATDLVNAGFLSQARGEPPSPPEPPKARAELLDMDEAEPEKVVAAKPRRILDIE